jgi:hypothetical protein
MRLINMSHGSTVDIATGYGLDNRGAGRVKIILIVQIGSGAHSTSYPIGTGGSFPGSKAAGA